jgi:acyl-CoA thioesterase
MDANLQKVTDLFRKDRFAAHTGIEIEDIAPGSARCSMEIQEQHLNGIGIVMGGALFTLADFTFGLAANSHGTIAVSSAVTIHYLRKSSQGKLTATATEISRNAKTGLYRVAITDAAGQLIADITGTCFFTTSTIEKAQCPK